MSLEKRKIYLEEADKPPASYYEEGKDDTPLRRFPFQVPDPQEWLKAPEFVPRSRGMLDDAFAPADDDIPMMAEEQNYAPYIPNTSAAHNMNIYNNPPISSYPYSPFSMGGGPQPHMVPGLPGSMAPMMPGAPLVPQMMSGGHGGSLPFGRVPFAAPNGYSANITHINAGIGPPIPAIVLRKKRRKRNRQTNSMAFNSSESPSSSHPTDPNGENSGSESPHGNTQETAIKHLGGSCPDLTEEQLEMWDDYLYDATVNHEQQQNNNVMQKSGYEIVSPRLMEVAEESVRGITNPEIRKLDREINGNSMTSSMILREYSDQMMPGRDHRSDGSVAKSLAEEMEQLTFRPQLTKYGYPQIDAPTVHMASFHHDSVKSSIVPRSFLSDDDPDRYEEDCFEGMNITVNAFDACDDLTLSDVESSTTRFEQIHQALKRGGQKYTELRPPDRVCCVVM